MKKLLLITVFTLLCLIGIPDVTTGDDSGTLPVLRGPYMGQKAPGKTPKLFAPGFICLENRNELNAVFSAKGDEFFFAVSDKTGKSHMLYTKQVGGIWTKPEIVFFSEKYGYVDMAFSPNGNRLYYCSDYPAPGNPSSKLNIWYIQREKDDWNWSKPTCLEKAINSEGIELYPTFTNDGTMYFVSSRKSSLGKKDVYKAAWKNGRFANPVHLGTAINSQFSESDTYVSPDEDYLIVTCTGRPDSIGKSDLYISFRDKDGEWMPLRNMGKPINTDAYEFCPMVSPDGKYFFFTRRGGIYWVSAEIIAQLRLKALDS